MLVVVNGKLVMMIRSWTDSTMIQQGGQSASPRRDKVQDAGLDVNQVAN